MPLLGSWLAGPSSPGGEGGGFVPYENELLLELPLGVQLRADLVVKVEKLLEGLGLGGHDESNDVHQQLRHRVAIEHDGEDALHGFDLALVGAFLQLRPQLRHGRCAIGGAVLDQTPRVFEERHGGQLEAARPSCGGAVRRLAARYRGSRGGGQPWTDSELLGAAGPCVRFERKIVVSGFRRKRSSWVECRWKHWATWGAGASPAR